MAVQQSLTTGATSTRAKIRNIMSALFSHAIRYEWLTFNPISKVRTSSARLRESDVLTPDDSGHCWSSYRCVNAQWSCLPAAGLRRSEMFALRWADLCLQSMQVQVARAVVRNRFGNVKTAASRKPVPLHPNVCVALLEWRRTSMYCDDADFLFPSVRLNGTAPLMLDMVLKKIIRPALKKAGSSERSSVGIRSGTHSQPTCGASAST